jgi:hypothetical protein
MYDRADSWAAQLAKRQHSAVRRAFTTPPEVLLNLRDDTTTREERGSMRVARRKPQRF